jgi:hypothetical protein
MWADGIRLLKPGATTQMMHIRGTLATARAFATRPVRRAFLGYLSKSADTIRLADGTRARKHQQCPDLSGASTGAEGSASSTSSYFFVDRNFSGGSDDYRSVGQKPALPFISNWIGELCMSFFTVLVSSKIALGALAVGTIAAGGTAAAYTGHLPAAMQESAHSIIGAPAPASTGVTTTTSVAVSTTTPTPVPSSTPGGPDATGPAAYGLCQAYTHGGLASSSIAYASLVKAANGTANITVYCAAVATPGKSATHRPVQAGVSAGATTQAVVPVAPTLPSQAAKGIGHKPAAPVRP